jgi:hypothetical protein
MVLAIDWKWDMLQVGRRLGRWCWWCVEKRAINIYKHFEFDQGSKTGHKFWEEVAFYGSGVLLFIKVLQQTLLQFEHSRIVQIGSNKNHYLLIQAKLLLIQRQTLEKSMVFDSSQILSARIWDDFDEIFKVYAFSALKTNLNKHYLSDKKIPCKDFLGFSKERVRYYLVRKSVLRFILG